MKTLNNNPYVIDIVIVTYNRLEKLKNTLQYYDKLSPSFNNIIVVNNHSADGTSEFLEDWKTQKKQYKKTVVETKENLGGSGGFYLGQKVAMMDNSDWIFIADDDAYPNSDIIEHFLSFISEHKSDRLSAVVTTVLNKDGSICTNHRGYLQKAACSISSKSTGIMDYEQVFFDVDFLSYVGSFLNARALEKVGLVNPKYFIYYDDSEHSLRLKKYGRIVCLPSMKVLHDFQEKSDESIAVSWADYYAIRNKTNMLIKHFPLIAIRQFLGHVIMLFKHTTDPYKQVRIDALRDGYLGRLGKSKKYYPGWCVKKV